jgi:hypothetical protein
LLGSLAIGAAGLAGCPVFPADNHWNLHVDRLPVLPNSDAIVRSIGAGEHMHADFGSGATRQASRSRASRASRASSSERSSARG